MPEQSNDYRVVVFGAGKKWNSICRRRWDMPLSSAADEIMSNGTEDALVSSAEEREKGLPEPERQRNKNETQTSSLCQH